MLVQSQADMDMAWEADDGEQAVALAAKQRPDVMLMDLRMPVLDGVEATRRITEEADAAGVDKPKIIALTTFNRDQAVVEAVQAGASGYLLKSAEPEFLLAAIRTVYSGYSVIAPGSVHELFQHAARTVPVAGPDLAVMDELSPRERDVFLLAAKGLGNAEMAQSLFVSEATVKSHLRSVLSKLGLRTRLQLVAFAYEHGFSGRHPDAKATAARKGRSPSCNCRVLQSQGALHGAALRLLSYIASKPNAKGNHDNTENQVQPVVRGVHGHEVSAHVRHGDEAVDPQDEVDCAATDEVTARHPSSPREVQACCAEQQMDNIVQDGYLEDSKKHGARVMSCEGHGAVIAGDARDKSQDANSQENPAQNQCCVVQRQPHHVVVLRGV